MRLRACNDHGYKRGPKQQPFAEEKVFVYDGDQNCGIMFVCSYDKNNNIYVVEDGCGFFENDEITWWVPIILFIKE